MRVTRDRRFRTVSTCTITWEMAKTLQGEEDHMTSILRHLTTATMGASI